MATAPKDLKFRDSVANGRSVKVGKHIGCLSFHNFIVGNSPIVGKPSHDPLGGSGTGLNSDAIIDS